MDPARGNLYQILRQSLIDEWPEMQDHVLHFGASIKNWLLEWGNMMRGIQNLTRLLFCMAGLAVGGAALAQEVTGTLGSPSATTTVSNKQLPAPDPAFGGVIKNDALQSKA
jgi:hypothetical protein